jgi:exosortase/archaeosortase family protein
VAVRLAAVIVAVALAYHFSLGTLLRDWRYQTPLADLSLVPPVAAGLLVVAARRHGIVGATRLGRLDLVIATLCLLATAAVAVAGPALLANYYWAVRPDLLSLPLAATGAIVLLFGTRTVIAFLFPLGFLALAWPLPHAVLAEQVLERVTTLTSVALRAILGVLPVARVMPGAGDMRLFVPHGAHGFIVSVASACSGTESLFGFGLIGFATLYLVRGPFLRRLAWLALGMVAVWVGNLVRILALLAAGRWLGQGIAIDALHPVAGILMLNLVFGMLLLVMRRFGLDWRRGRQVRHADTPLTQPAPPAELPTGRQLSRRLAVLVVAAVGLAVVNGQLAAAATGFSNTQRPASASFRSLPTAGPDWTVTELRSMDWSRPYFGDRSEWIRYRLRPRPGLALAHRYTIWADAILTPDLGALLAHPVRSCYRLHRYTMLVDQRVILASGIVGEQLVYQRPTGERWHVLTWEWPVRTGRDDVGHERMVLLASTQATVGSAVAPQRPEGRLRSSVLRALNVLGPDRDPNPTLAAGMLAAGDGIIAARLGPPSSGTVSRA